MIVIIIRERPKIFGSYVVAANSALLVMDRGSTPVKLSSQTMHGFLFVVRGSCSATMTAPNLALSQGPIVKKALGGVYRANRYTIKLFLAEFCVGFDYCLGSHGHVV